MSEQETSTISMIDTILNKKGQNLQTTKVSMEGGIFHEMKHESQSESKSLLNMSKLNSIDLNISDTNITESMCVTDSK